MPLTRNRDRKKSMKITLAQLAPEVRKLERNYRVMRKVLSESTSDLVIFGELFLSGYLARDDLQVFAQGEENSYVDGISRLARKLGKSVIFGLPLEDSAARGIYYNAAAVIDEHGEVFYYRKNYLPNFGPFEEGLYFSRGVPSQTVFLSGIKAGVEICYDAFFPEISASYALQGADAVICISASPFTSMPLFEKILPARAIENTVFFLFNNIVGSELGLVFWGGSQVYTPKGRIVSKAPYFTEKLLDIEIDIDEVRTARRYRPTIRDQQR